MNYQNSGRSNIVNISNKVNVGKRKSNTKNKGGLLEDMVPIPKLSVEDQLSKAESRYRLQMKKYDVDGNSVNKKRLTMKDYMKKR